MINKQGIEQYVRAFMIFYYKLSAFTAFCWFAYNYIFDYKSLGLSAWLGVQVLVVMGVVIPLFMFCIASIIAWAIINIRGNSK